MPPKFRQGGRKKSALIYIKSARAGRRRWCKKRVFKLNRMARLGPKFPCRFDLRRRGIGRASGIRPVRWRYQSRRKRIVESALGALTSLARSLDGLGIMGVGIGLHLCLLLCQGGAGKAMLQCVWLRCTAHVADSSFCISLFFPLFLCENGGRRPILLKVNGKKYRGLSEKEMTERMRSHSANLGSFGALRFFLWPAGQSRLRADETNGSAIVGGRRCDACPVLFVCRCVIQKK